MSDERACTLPSRLGKLRVEVETTVDLSATFAWLPMHSEQPGISVRAPTCTRAHRIGGRAMTAAVITSAISMMGHDGYPTLP